MSTEPKSKTLLQTLLERERTAIGIYNTLFESVEHDHLKEIFGTMKREAEDHYRLVAYMLRMHQLMKEATEQVPLASGEKGRSKVDERLVNAWRYGLAQANATKGEAHVTADEVLDKLGERFIEFVKKREGITLVGKEPMETVNNVYRYFTERGYFTNAYAKGGPNGLIFYEDRAIAPDDEDAFPVATAMAESATPPYVVIRAALNRAHRVRPLIRFIDVDEGGVWKLHVQLDTAPEKSEKNPEKSHG